MTVSERDKVEIADIKVGDRVYVESLKASGESRSWTGTVKHVGIDFFETAEFSFYESGSYVLYRLPAPDPVEPLGVGAVIEDRDGGLWSRTDEDWSPWKEWNVIGGYQPWSEFTQPVIVRSEGYTP